MSKAPIIEHDTWLYHPTKGARLFGAGEQHPGEGWSDEPSTNDAATDQSAGQNDWGEKLNQALAEQKGTFDAAWGDLAEENDRLGQELAKRQGELATATATIAEQAQTIAARDDELANLKAQIAKFDPDGDGKPGGSVSKASK